MILTLYKCSVSCRLHPLHSIGRNVQTLRQSVVRSSSKRVVWCRLNDRYCSTSNVTSPLTDSQATETRKYFPAEGPTLKEFIGKDAVHVSHQVKSDEAVPYLSETDFHGNNRRGSISWAH